MKTKREAVQQDLASSGALLASLSEEKNTLEQKILKLQAELAVALKGNAISDSKNSNISSEEVKKLDSGNLSRWIFLQDSRYIIAVTFIL